MEFTQEVRKATDPIYQKISKIMPEIEWSVHAPYIHKINQLKKEKNAIILAHNYQTPEIYHGISDVAADSLALAIEASKTSADIIVMAGVHFMAETSKLMSPEKKVLLPDMEAGCSLSSSVTGKDVRLLKEKYPDEITIVMQHWYENLDVGETGFSVTLNFGDRPEPLYVPYDCIITFVDPSVEFGIKFERSSTIDASNELTDALHSISNSDPIEQKTGTNISTEVKEPKNDKVEAEVVQLDKFRKP